MTSASGLRRAGRRRDDVQARPTRARRGSLWATSRIRWSFVYEWIVFIRPRSIASRSWTTFAAGARQFVVQLALLMMSCASGS